MTDNLQINSERSRMRVMYGEAQSDLWADTDPVQDKMLRNFTEMHNEIAILTLEVGYLREALVDIRNHLVGRE